MRMAGDAAAVSRPPSSRAHSGSATTMLWRWSACVAMQCMLILSRCSTEAVIFIIFMIVIVSLHLYCQSLSHAEDCAST